MSQPKQPTPIRTLLGEYLEKRGVTKQQVAEYAQVSPTAISFLFNGRPDGQPYMGFRGNDPLYWKVVDFLRIPKKEAEDAAAEESLAWATEMAKRPPRPRKRAGRSAKQRYPKPASNQRDLVPA